MKTVYKVTVTIVRQGVVFVEMENIGTLPDALVVQEVIQDCATNGFRVAIDSKLPTWGDVLDAIDDPDGTITVGDPIEVKLPTNERS